ncbi:MAG: NAD-dependent epimerase/dehydratase family protein [Caulobacteraceae bacterium]
MTRTALIIGGTGQIGLATAAALRADGWRVIAASTSGAAVPGAEAMKLDRESPGAVAKAIGSGVDALIDTIAYDESHARQLLEVQADVGALAVISSASVYRDADGRTLDEARETGFPRFPLPIDEDQPTVEPGPATYSTRKAALERALLEATRTALAILRPCAIHGPGSRHPREWFFVKRILDKRRAVPLAWSGESRFHTTATANIAALIRLVLASPATHVLNIADPEAPSVAEIGAAIARAEGAELELIPFEGPPRGTVGDNPWAVPRPLVVSTARAEALGYRPAAAYQDGLAETCASATAMARAGVVFPDYINALFDYPAEDAWLAENRP